MNHLVIPNRMKQILYKGMVCWLFTLIFFGIFPFQIISAPNNHDSLKLNSKFASFSLLNFQSHAYDIYSSYSMNIITKPSILSQENNLDINKSLVIPVGDRILFQPYYWKVPDDGLWWQVIENHVSEWKSNLGIDGLWLPPAQKTPFGDTSTYGYEPYDYYDLGEFMQKERVRTRYGTRTALESLIQTANNIDVGVIADIVINHNNGGWLEYNAFTGEDTYTDFMHVASGRFLRNYTHFYPCIYGQQDNLAWGNLPDLCHLHPYVHDELLKYGDWLRDEIGYDGWRFDVAYGVAPSMIEDWATYVGGFSVSEFWNGIPITSQEIDDALNSVGYSTFGFDFPLMYEFRDMVMENGSYDMRNLLSKGLMHLRPNNTITFVANHDTHKDDSDKVPYHRELGYAYILMHESYPMIFWKDYYDFNYYWHIRTLCEIRQQFARGTTSVLYSDPDLYIMQRNGDPGLILALNDAPTTWKTVSVKSKWRDTRLYDLTGQAPAVDVQNDGFVNLSVPPMGYAIFSNYSTIRSVNPILDHANFHSFTNISKATITIDGQYDYNWWKPVYFDEDGDAGYRQVDLNRVYITNDDENLYLGVGIGTLEWMGDPIHLIFSFNTKPGGNREDPGMHSGISFTGNDLPDEIYYAVLDNRSIPGYLKHVENITHYSWTGETWQNRGIVEQTRFATNPYMGFIEFKIPLDELSLENGGDFQMIVYSSVKGRYGAMDTSPQNSEIDSSGDSFSWLTMPEPLNIHVLSENNSQIPSNTSTTDSDGTKSDDTDDNLSTHKISGYSFKSFMFLTIFLGITAILIKSISYRYYNKKCNNTNLQ
ncbi:alpha-amylase domain-containing protein [Candidatus Harpocratesius sp.]